MNVPPIDAFLAGLVWGASICAAVNHFLNRRARRAREIAAHAKASATTSSLRQRQLLPQDVIDPARTALPVPIIVPRPTWFQIDPIDDRTTTIKLTMTKGEVAAAAIELHSIGHRPAMAGFRNALQMAAKAMQ